MRLFNKLLLLFLVALPLVVTIFDEGRAFARAEDETEEDEIKAEEDEAIIETGEGSEDETPPEDAAKTQGSPDIDVTILFTKPQGNGMELPAGKPVEFLIGITNNGDKEYIVDAADVSFKYPMDFTYTIQNFSAAVYNKALKPKQEATVFYNFLTSEAFAGRPLGLQINLAYHDADGEDFVEPAFNATINIVEVDEGLDGETFFLYIFLLAFSVLLLLAGHHVLTAMGVGGSKKGGASKSKQQQHTSQVEVGTTNKNGVDFDWLPDHVKADLKRKAAEAAASNGSAKKGSSKGASKDLPPKGTPAAAIAKGVATRSSPRLRKT